jgi:methylglutaconyl-CoA hydratase
MKTLTVSREPRGVARVTMARPEVFNAFDEAMVAELDTTFAELGADDSVRVIVLTGEGKAFSAGADLEWMQRASGARSRRALA